MTNLYLTVVTPERIVFEGAAESVSAMTRSGEITVLANHEPLVTLLRAGEMRIRHEGGEELLAISAGVLTVDANVVSVLAETAERSEELELGAVEEAKRRAEEALKVMRNKNDVGFTDAAAHLERELARYKVALKGRKVHRTGKDRTGKGLQG